MKNIATFLYSGPTASPQTLTGLNDIEYLNIQDSEEESTHESSTNILDTLQSIQLENPNIETVFIESDEEIEQDQVNQVAIETQNSSNNIALDLDRYEEDIHPLPESTQVADKQFISKIKVAASTGSQSSVDLTLNLKNSNSQVNKKNVSGSLIEETKNELNLKLLLVTTVSLAKQSDRYVLAAKEATEKDLAPMNGKLMKLLEIADRNLGRVFLAIPEDVRCLLAKSGKPISLNFEKQDQFMKSVVDINSDKSDLSSDTIELDSDENVSHRVKVINKERGNLSEAFGNNFESLSKKLAESPVSIFSSVVIKEDEKSNKILSGTNNTKKSCKSRNAFSNFMSQHEKSSKVVDKVISSNNTPKSSVLVVAKKAIGTTKVFYNCNSNKNPRSGSLSFKLRPSAVINRTKKDSSTDSDLAKKIISNSQSLIVGNKVLTSITSGKRKKKIKSGSVNSSIFCAKETSGNTKEFDLSKEKPACANLKSLAETASKITLPPMKVDKVQKGFVVSKKKSCKEDKVISQKVSSLANFKDVDFSEDQIKLKKDTPTSNANKAPPPLLNLQAKQISEQDLLNAGPKGYCLVEVNDRSKNANCLKTAVLAIPDDIAAHCAANNDPLCINVPGLGSVVIPLSLISGAVCKNCSSEIKQPPFETVLMHETSPNLECSICRGPYKPTLRGEPKISASPKSQKNVCLRPATLSTVNNIKNFSNSLCTNHSPLVVPNLLKDLLHESTESYFKENDLIQSNTSLSKSSPKAQENTSSFRRPITERDLWRIHRNYPKTNPLLLEQIRETMITLHNYNQKFHCWSPIKGADDKEDFLGFPDGDTRSRVCTTKMISQIIKLQNSLDLSLRKMHLVRLYKLEKSQLKDPLAMMDMEEWSKKRLENIDNPTPSELVCKTNFTNLMSWIKHHNNTPPEENLLITSKVELLEHSYAGTENMLERNNRKRLSEPTKCEGKKLKVSTGYGLMGNIQNWRYEDCIPSKGRPRKHAVKVPKPVGRPRKDASAKKELRKKRMKKTRIFIPPEFTSILKPCCVMLDRIQELEKFPISIKSKAPRRKRRQYEIPQRSNNTGRRKKVLNYAAIHRGIQVQPQEELSRIHLSCEQGDESWTKRYVPRVRPEGFNVLHSLEDFHNSINPERPILVINEKQWATSNLIELSENNNIVYPVTKLEDVPVSLAQFVATCNINFVKPDVLCKYLSGSNSKIPNSYV